MINKIFKFDKNYLSTTTLNYFANQKTDIYMDFPFLLQSHSATIDKINQKLSLRSETKIIKVALVKLS